MVKYERRQLLGFTDGDGEWIVDLTLEHIAKNSYSCLSYLSFLIKRKITFVIRDEKIIAKIAIS